MVMLGGLFILITGLAAIKLWRRTLWTSRFLLKVFLWSIPLPLAAIQLGWITAEVGRQPWIVYKLLGTSEAYSMTVTAGEVWFSIILFSLIYILLGSLYVFLLVREVKHGPQAITERSA